MADSYYNDGQNYNSGASSSYFDYDSGVLPSSYLDPSNQHSVNQSPYNNGQNGPYENPDINNLFSSGSYSDPYQNGRYQDMTGMNGQQSSWSFPDDPDDGDETVLFQEGDNPYDQGPPTEASFDPTKKAALCLRSYENGQLYYFDQDQIRIGRNGACDLVIDKPGISRLHAVITCSQGRWYLSDQSTNGTYLNGRRLIPHNPILLSQGSVVSFANSAPFEISFQNVIPNGFQKASIDLYFDTRFFPVEAKGTKPISLYECCAQRQKILASSTYFLQHKDGKWFLFNKSAPSQPAQEVSDGKQVHLNDGTILYFGGQSQRIILQNLTSFKEFSQQINSSPDDPYLLSKYQTLLNNQNIYIPLVQDRDQIPSLDLARGPQASMFHGYRFVTYRDPDDLVPAYYDPGEAEAQHPFAKIGIIPGSSLYELAKTEHLRFLVAPSSSQAVVVEAFGQTSAGGSSGSEVQIQDDIERDITAESWDLRMHISEKTAYRIRTDKELFLSGDRTCGRFTGVDRVFSERIVCEVMMTSNDSSRQSRSMLEARTDRLRQFSHPSLAAYIWCETDQNSAMVVQRIPSGQTLAQIIEREQRIPGKEAVKYTLQILDLILHLNQIAAPACLETYMPEAFYLLPDHSVITRQMNSIRDINIYDRAFVDNGEKTFHPPEYYKQQKDSRSAVYSLGMLMYWMLSGHNPNLILAEEGTLTKFKEFQIFVPKQLEQLVMRATRASADARFQTLESMKTALLDCLDSGVLS